MSLDLTNDAYNQESQWGSEYMEVIGRVEKNFTIMEYKSTNLGNDFGTFHLSKIKNGREE